MRSLALIRTALLALAAPAFLAAQPTQCSIAGQTYSAGTLNAANACQSCQPAVSTSNWTNLANGSTCNDNNACTTGDICTSGLCVGTPKICNDDNACTVDSCDASSGLCVFTPVNCNDGNICTTDSCNVVTGLCEHSPISCNDNNACTNDTCDPSSGCVYTEIECNDNNSCTADSCDVETGCHHTPVEDTTPCDDNSACTTNDACFSGVCTGTAISCDDGSFCTSDSCDPATGCQHADICSLPTSPFQVSYAANLNAGDSAINITNTGSTDPNDPTVPDSLCANIYTFDASEEMVSCCSCLVTPNALVSLSVQGDLISNTLSPATPTSVVVSIVATDAGAGLSTNCNAAVRGTPALGLSSWGTTLHALPSAPVTYGVTEDHFQPSTLSPAEYAHLTSFCGFINANGSGFGICKSCRTGGLGGAKK